VLAMRCCSVTVRGRVQGVGFRGGLCHVARGAGLRGWVRNRLDGSVEALVSGEAAAVDALLAWVAHGPPGARVTEVSAHERELRADLPNDFELRPTA